MYEIIQKYTESHRYYHNFNHIARMFEVAGLYNLILTKEQYLAIFFHDVVYNPKRHDNEEQSVKVFNDWCFNRKANNFDVKIVRQIILDTKLELPTIEESKIVIDLDLYDLSTSRYFPNAVLIEQEFLTCVTSAKFDKGRKEWIKSFLRRNTIYVSNWGKQFETKARTNMKNELKG